MSSALATFVAEHENLIEALFDWVQRRNARVFVNKQQTYEQAELSRAERKAAQAHADACERVFLHRLDKVAPARDGKCYGN